ncbi:halocyanin domain-containing protein [Halorussus halobius]|uniref:halocyanin domain-containing protein n=1 Tax=Halorussus halobius TaxID=1710537 RepID=UPI001091F9E3|nr:halocyanin domain-containing protein [Halorussus halobius]
MTDETLTRRTALKAMAVGAASVALAGCSSSGGSGGDDESNGDGSGDESNGDSGGDSTDFGGWFDDVDNFDGVVDETGSDEVTVDVGAQGNGGNYAFSPAAVSVSTGTTVVWEWTGQGSLHNVVAEDGSFESEQTQEEGFTFEHTFEETGTYEYVCVPHEAMGMKGAIVVE